MYIGTDQSRRAFLQRISTLSVAGAAAPLLGTLAASSDAAAATATDYKALVCVFLCGGNDYANTLPPYDDASYGTYQKIRQKIAIPRDNLAGTVLSAGDLGGRQYALNPALGPLKQLYDFGDLAVILNMGNLVQPITKQEYVNRTAPVPPKLFSHNDQQSFYESSSPEGAKLGWGGRIGDIVRASNSQRSLTCVNVGQKSLLLSGDDVVPYTISDAGPVELCEGRQSLFGSAEAYSKLRTIMTAPNFDVLAHEHAIVSARSLDLGSSLARATSQLPPSLFAQFKGGGLQDQLKSIAAMIAVAPSFGIRRQIFFTTMHGWDMHDGLKTRHPALLSELAAGLKAFHATTTHLGVGANVTTFTASEFGRTLRINGDGSDHGWGGVQFVMGGAVRGKAIYGRPPAMGIGTNDDVGGGRLIPTTGVDQFAATLASWLGVSQADLPTILPNITRYNPSSWNLGFV